MDLKSRLEANVARIGHSAPAASSPALAQGERAGRRRDTSLFLLAIDRIRPDEDQVRKENKSNFDEEIQELSESIKDVGVLEPLNVRYIADGDFYRVVAGERRYVASKLAGLAEVPVKLLEVDDRTARRIQLQENLHRADLTALELSEALHGLASDGASVEELAKFLHKSKPFVAKALGIARNLSPDAKALGAELPLAHLYEVSQVPEDQQGPVVQFVKENKATAEQLREHVSGLKARGGAGRPASVKAFRRVVACPNGVSVTFASRNATEGAGELLEALAYAKKMLSKEKADAA
jgi:ParB/RepB/Spo0J family partition protein